MLPIKFQDNQPFVSGKKQRIDFQNSDHVCHLGFPIQTILAIFYLQVTPMLPTKFHVSLPFCSGEETKNRCPVHKFQVNWPTGVGRVGF